MTRLVPWIAGALVAALIAAAVASIGYAAGVAALGKDPSVWKALEAGRWLAAWIDWSAHSSDSKRHLVAALAAALGVATATGFLLLAVLRPDRGSQFQTASDLHLAGYFRADILFVGRARGFSLSWKTWRKDEVTGIREAQTARKLIGGRPVHLPDFGHALISGPTRSGKGAALIIPNALEFPGSMVILDIRGETFERTAGWRARFSKVIKLAPSSERSHCYNPLDFVRRVPGLFEADVMAIAGGVVNQSSGDKYWAKDAIEVVAGAIGYVLEAERVPEKTLGAVMDVLIGRDDAQDTLREIVESVGPRLSAFTTSKLTPFAAMTEKQWNGVLGMVRTSLSPFNNPVTRKVLSRSSFDLFALRKTPHTVYVDFRLSQLNAMGGLCNVLVTQMMNDLTDDLRAKGEHQVLFMLDEFTTLGEIAPLMGLLKVGAGNGVAVWAFVQSMTNVKEVYKETGLDNFLDNIEAFVFLGGSSSSVLDHVERLLGKTIVRQKVRRSQPGRSAFEARTSVETREVEKPLMSADELARLDRRVALVLPRGAGPIRLWRNYWFADAAMAKKAAARLPPDAIPDLSKALPPSFVTQARDGEATARRGPKLATPAATIAARLGPLRDPAIEPVPAARPGRRFLANPSIQARRAGPPVVKEVMRATADRGEARAPDATPEPVSETAASTAARIADSTPRKASASRSEANGGDSRGAVDGARQSQPASASNTSGHVPAEPIARPHEVADAALCGVPIATLWRATTAKKIADMAGGPLLGDLLASHWARDDFRSLAPSLRRSIRATLGKIGALDWTPFEWPPQAPTDAVAALRMQAAAANAAQIAAILVAEPAGKTDVERATFEGVRDDAIVAVVETQRASIGEADAEDLTISQILALRDSAKIRPVV